MPDSISEETWSVVLENTKQLLKGFTPRCGPEPPCSPAAPSAPSRAGGRTLPKEAGLCVVTAAAGAPERRDPGSGRRSRQGARAALP